MKRIILGLLIFAIIAGGLAMFSEAHANRAERFFESLKHTDGQFNGKPFLLLPWERQIIRDVYGTLNQDGTRQYKFIYIEIPKKNGKSELAAGAALYHLFADGEKAGKIYSCAADREQASLVFDVAAGMIEQAPALAKRAKVVNSMHKIIDKTSGSIYKAESAEAYTKHGLNLSACIFDELHAQPNRNLWDVMTFGAGDARRQPIWWIITTAGDDPDRVTVGWEQHEYAAAVLAARNGTGNPDDDDPTWYVAIYSYEGDDIYNEENWYKANPSLDHTISIKSVREAAAKAKIKPADERLFRWLRLNQWTTSKLTTWLELNLFDATIGDWSPLELIGRDCYIGLDLSTTTDLAAIAPLFPPQGDQLDWRLFWEAWIPKENMAERIERDHVPYDKWAAGSWVTATEGNVIDYTVIRERILALAELYNVKEVVADPAFATMLLQELQQAGLTVVTVPQTFVNLTDPMNQSEVLLKEHKLTHTSSPVARWAFGNTSIAKNGSGLIKYVKEVRGKSVIRTKRIDPIAAWITAMCRARFYSSSVDLSALIMGPNWGL